MMRTLQARNGRLWLKTVISCQHRRAPLRGPTAGLLSRITVYLFGAGRGRCLLGTPFVAENGYLPSRPAGAKGEAPGPGWGYLMPVII